MVRIEESIKINVLPQKIWPMIRWDRVPEWMGMIKSVEYTSEEKETIGATAHWIGEVGGVKSEWDTETTEWEPYTRGAWRSTGGTFTGISSMTLTPIDTGTRATFVMDYDFPNFILGRVIDKLRICKIMEKGTERAMANLKSILEKQNPSIMP